MVRQYAEEQARREQEIRQQKAKVEAEKEAIFLELKAKEERRRAEEEYQERLRNELDRKSVV